MPKLIINIHDDDQFSDSEREMYHQMKACLKRIEPKDAPDLTLEHFEVVELNPERSTYLQKNIVEQVLKPMYRLAKCWDIDAAFWGYYGIHRVLQRHYLAINLALKRLHQAAKSEVPSSLFLQMMDFELLVSLRAMSQDGVLTYKVLQFVVELNANYQTLIRRIEQDGKWQIHPFYQIEDFAQEKDDIDVQLEDAEMRNERLRDSLNAAIQNNEDLERRLAALTQEVTRLQSEVQHYKEKKTNLVKQAIKGGASIVKFFKQNEPRAEPLHDVALNNRRQGLF